MAAQRKAKSGAVRRKPATGASRKSGGAGPARPGRAARSAGAKFKMGTRVVYPFHGVGVVRGIERINLLGENRWYYILDFRNGELTVKLPVDQQNERGMRHIISRNQVPKIFAILRKKPNTEESDWKVRHNIYLEKLKSGDIFETAKVARNLAKRGPEGELSMSEKRLLEASMQLLIHEIAAASNDAVDKVEQEINRLVRGNRA